MHSTKGEITSFFPSKILLSFLLCFFIVISITFALQIQKHWLLKDSGLGQSQQKRDYRRWLQRIQWKRELKQNDASNYVAKKRPQGKCYLNQFEILGLSQVEKKAFSPILFPYSLKRLVRCADQQKMSVTCPKRVMVNLVSARMIDSKSMASLAKMGRATAWWGCAPPWRSSAPSYGDQVGGQTPVMLALPLYIQRKIVSLQVTVFNHGQSSILSLSSILETVPLLKILDKWRILVLLDVANKNKDSPVKFEFQINNFFLSVSMSHAIFGWDLGWKKVFIWNLNLTGCPVLYLAALTKILPS